MKEEDNILNNQYEDNNYLKELSKIMPFSVPAQYFESLHNIIYNKIQLDAETEEAAPLLNGIGKNTPYSVPENYFNTITFNAAPVKNVTIVRLSIWKKMMVAAGIIGLIISSIAVWDKQRKEDISVAIQHINTNDLINQLDTSGTLFSNTNNDEVGFIEVSEPQDELKYTSDEDLQQYLYENDTPNNNVEI